MVDRAVPEDYPNVGIFVIYRGRVGEVMHYECFSHNQSAFPVRDVHTQVWDMVSLHEMSAVVDRGTTLPSGRDTRPPPASTVALQVIRGG